MDIDNVLKGHGIGIGGSNLKSRQSGTFYLNSADILTQTISAVDLTKSIIRLTYIPSATGTDDSQKTLPMAMFLNSTTIQFSRKLSDATYYPIIKWEVIEFNNVKSLQSGQSNMSTSSMVQSISAINVSKSILFFSAKVVSSSGACGIVYTLPSGEITTSTQLTFAVSTSTFYDSIYYFIVEFN